MVINHFLHPLGWSTSSIQAALPGPRHAPSPSTSSLVQPLSLVPPHHRVHHDTTRVPTEVLVWVWLRHGIHPICGCNKMTSTIQIVQQFVGMTLPFSRTSTKKKVKPWVLAKEQNSSKSRFWKPFHRGQKRSNLDIQSENDGFSSCRAHFKVNC